MGRMFLPHPAVATIGEYPANLTETMHRGAFPVPLRVAAGLLARGRFPSLYSRIGTDRHLPVCFLFGTRRLVIGLPAGGFT